MCFDILVKMNYLNMRCITFIISYCFISCNKGHSVDERGGATTIADADAQDEDESKVVITDLSDLTSASTSRRQLDAGTLDAKVVKALKKQEDKREKRNARKKEVKIQN